MRMGGSDPCDRSHSDFRWEREWRKRDDYLFQASDVAFGICPANELNYFTNIAHGKITFINPDWNQLTLTTYLQKNAPQLIPHL
jgi:hypothetical protein